MSVTANLEMEVQPSTQLEWQWMRVYYFEPRKDDLILDGIWPSLKSACAAGGHQHAYFQRDWSGGPNILIGFTKCCIQQDREALTSAIARYLTRFPSMTSISAKDYANSAERLSQMESNTADPLQTNNSVMFVDEPVLTLVQHEGVKQAMREYLVQSSTLCIEWIDCVRRGVIERNHLAVHILAALVWLVNQEQLTPYLSLRSHAEGYLRLTDREGKDTRSKFERCCSMAQGATVKALLHQAISSLEKGEEIIPGMARLLDLFRSTLNTLYRGVATRRYKLEPLWKSSIDESPAFRSWQMTISLAYRTLNQLGITPVERFLICYLLSYAIEDRCGHAKNPFWDWEKGPLDLSKSNLADVEKAFPYFLQVQ